MIYRMLQFLIDRYAKAGLGCHGRISPTAGKIFPTPEPVVEHIRKSRNFKRKPMYMGWRLTITLHVFILLHCSLLSAQEVSYCEPYSDRFTLRQEMLGKIGDYYWVSAISKKRVTHREANTEERN